MMLSVKKCAVALVIVSATIVASLASPTDVELDKEDNILVVRVTDDQQQQRERQERRLDSVASAENIPVTIEIFKEKETKSGGEIVEKIEVQIVPEGGRNEEDEGQPVLVPQLWSNYTGPVEPPAEEVGCDIAQLKCAYRAGCGLALQNYMLGCADVASGRTASCNTHCRHSLIALMSTHEGKRLMKCDCKGNEKCEATKGNVEQCRSEVVHATRPNTVVTCSAAEWICAADPQCSTALEYYNRFCGAMFRGRRCTKRCLNSIRILQRQKGGDKLEECRCTGDERYDCEGIKNNMEELCFRKSNELDSNEIDDGGFADRRKKHKSSSAFRIAIEKLLLIACLVVSAIATMLFDAVEATSPAEDA